MKKHSPPKWADRFLTWYCNPALLESIQGDVHELFYRTVRHRSKLMADLQFIWNVIRFFRWSTIKRTQLNPSGSFMMHRNYFTVFKRNLIKQKGYSFLNLSGLAIGIACFILISFYIRDEYSYDRFHSKADRIFRMHEIFQSDGIGERSASLPFPVAEAMLNDYPGQVVRAVRLFNFQAPSLALSTTDHTKEFNEPRLFFTDSTFFSVFDFNLLKGDKKTALANPHSIVITKSMEEKYFGSKNAMGKYLEFQGNTNLLVTGVMEDVPSNVHFRFDFLISFETLKDFYEGKLPDGWYWNPCWTYFLLKDEHDVSTLQAAMPAFVNKYFPEFVKKDITLEFIPLTDIHLKSKMDYEIEVNGNLTTIYVFASIAVFVLIIACINFVNLSTARASRRAKEVGMRKTLGSSRDQLVSQFLFESITLCFMVVVFALAIVVLCLPYFNNFTEKNISLFALLDPLYITLLILFPIALGIVSGIYPAFVLSSFKPVTALKSAVKGEQGLSFRKVLVVIQFSLSIILLIGTGVALDQLDMLQKSDTGFQKDNVILVPVSRSPVAKNYESLKTEFLRNPNVKSVTAVEEVLGAKHQVGNYFFEGLTESKPFPRLNVRHDFLKTFDIPIVAGRDYSEDIVTDDSLAVVVNEQLVKQMGWKSAEEAVGKTLQPNPRRKIIGVVKDFNFTSRHQPIRPLVIDLNTFPEAFNLFIKYMAVRIDDKNRTESIQWLAEKWKEQIPGWPFEYFFLDSSLQNMYKAESRMTTVTLIFSGLSILVACLGLFGLAAFTVEQRRKEMSIRKVLGSSDAQIFVLFSSRFIMLILASIAVSFPLAYFLMTQWLSGFAYHVAIDFSLFGFAALAAVAIAFITIGFQAWKSAHTNPAETLKTE